MERGQSVRNVDQGSSQSHAIQTPPLTSPSYYFPHRGILRESCETTKLRVVFNGSAKTTAGRSLNNIRHTGPKLQRNISDILLWSRQHKITFMPDVTKMFRQIRVHQDDIQKLPIQRIL